ncbi:MAG: hypothetical protein Q9224_005045 [Gallowayella concinna]
MQAFRLMLEHPQFQSHKNDMVTDYKKQLLSAVELSRQAIQPIQFRYRAEDEDDVRLSAPLLKFDIKPAGTLTVGNLLDHLTSANTSKALNQQDVLQGLNIFLRHYTKQSPDHITIGSSSFPLRPTDTDRVGLQGGLQAIRGFFSSVRVATSRILVNVNVVHAPFYDAIRLDLSMKAFQATNGKDPYKLQAFLKRVRVEVPHLKARKIVAGRAMPRVKTILALATKQDGLVNGLPSSNTSLPPKVVEFGAGPKGVKFWISDDQKQLASTPQALMAGKSGGGKRLEQVELSAGNSGCEVSATSGLKGHYISVAQYFEQQYNKEIPTSLSDLPVVNVGTSANPSYLPAEACVVVAGQNWQQKLDPQHTAEMIRFAVRPPSKNATSIERDGPSAIGLSNLTRFQFRYKAAMIPVSGRILAPPKVLYHDPQIQDREAVKSPMSSASWFMSNKNKRQLKFNSGQTLSSWHVLVLEFNGQTNPFREDQRLQGTLRMFSNALRNAGITIPSDPSTDYLPMRGVEDPALEAKIRVIRKKICLVILPEEHPVVYARIKSIGDVKYGVLTICVIGPELAKGKMSFMSNVALKFNLKLGGVNQKMDDEQLDIVSEGTTMIVGIDVTHPSPGSSESAPSVAGMVASVDRHLGQWPADLRLQERAPKEIVSSLDAMLKTCLTRWKNRNTEYPQNILVYRDGVSEGEYKSVWANELPLLRKACRELYLAEGNDKGSIHATDNKNKKNTPAKDEAQGTGKADKQLPRMTIIIVGKRTQTRAFTADKGNPPNGTVVDRQITEACNWDWFLFSHKAIQGTAHPGHYFVILDEIFNTGGNTRERADRLEGLTYQLCYLCGRCTTAVSIPTPVHYAHSVCERARFYLNRYYDSAAQSSASRQSGGSGRRVLPRPSDADIRVHSTLRDTMFYI